MKRALCIGIDNYPGTNMDLAVCKADAEQWAVTLESYDFTVATITDSQASGQGIRSLIKDMIAPCKSGDSIVVQYSGHGTYVADRDGDELDGFDEAICPWDVVQKGVITDDELAELLGNRKQGINLTFIADSCFSGAVSRFAGIPQRDRMVRFMPPEIFGGTGPMVEPIRRAGQIGRRRYASLLLSACQEWEYAYEGPTNGAFTWAAIDALGIRPVTYRDWYAEIRKRLPSASFPQTPRLVGSSDRRRLPIFS